MCVYVLFLCGTCECVCVCVCASVSVAHIFFIILSEMDAVHQCEC